MGFAAPLWLALALTAAAPIGAQQVGTLAAERARLAAVTGDTTLRGEAARRIRVPVLPFDARVLLPEVRLTWNSGLPYSLNDGALWAGRGLSGSVSGGFDLELPIRPRLRLALAPRLTFTQNRPFQIFAGTDTNRSEYANPLYSGQVTADYPMRFGDRPLVAIDPGNTRAELAFARVVAGVSASDEWWGPAIRNTLILSNNAAGIPRFYLKTAKPIRTRLGALDVSYFAGTLTESKFFDTDATDDYRAVSALRLALRPAFDSAFTVGLARVVYSSEDEPLRGVFSHAGDVLIRWQFLEPQPVRRGVDQLMSLFWHWIPAAGLELYGEYARMDNPRSVTELLTAAHHTGGYTLGLQWLMPREAHRYLRLQSEVTYLEQSIVFPDRPPPDFYTGRATAQGYTQRGQVIGAAIGPGGSSQFLALDWIASSWQGGWFAGRVRWNNDALYRKVGANFFQHDVTVLTGLRAARRTSLTDFSAEFTVAKRLNYLFQWGGHNPGGFRTVDVNNVTLALVATPR